MIWAAPSFTIHDGDIIALASQNSTPVPDLNVTSTQFAVCLDRICQVECFCTVEHPTSWVQPPNEKVPRVQLSKLADLTSLATRGWLLKNSNDYIRGRLMSHWRAREITTRNCLKVTQFSANSCARPSWRGYDVWLHPLLLPNTIKTRVSHSLA